MPPRRRLKPEARRDELLRSAALSFAERGYDDVLMEEVAHRAGASRALLYRHFPSKGDLFAAVYAEAAERLLDATPLHAGVDLAAQVRDGLDAHLDYFVANRRTVIAANRTLAGDPAIQAIITDELAVLRERLLSVVAPERAQRDFVAAVLRAWLLFVRDLSVAWLEDGAKDREQLREVCASALTGALASISGPTQKPMRDVDGR